VLPLVTVTLRVHSCIYHRPESHPRRGKEWLERTI